MLPGEFFVVGIFNIIIRIVENQTSISFSLIIST